MAAKQKLTAKDYADIPCPEIPCTKCPDNKYGNNYCGFEVRVAERAQKKLLEYLIMNATFSSSTDYEYLESMLKEIK